MGVLFRLWINSWIPYMWKARLQAMRALWSSLPPLVMLPCVSAHIATWAPALGLPALGQCPPAVLWDLQVRQIAAVEDIALNSEGHVIQCHQ